MIQTDQTLEDLTLLITQEIHVEASLEVTFAALLDQLGPYNETPDGKSLNMKIEPWPGGRWYRDLGDDNGTSGRMFKPSDGLHCLSFQGRFFHLPRYFRMSNTGSPKLMAEL